jgi:hypothetical protein
MKTTQYLCFAGLSSIALAKIKVEARYSNEMVDVGDLDLHKVTWEEIYASTGNQRSVVTDNSYDTYGNPCTHGSAKADNRVRVNINGQWGRIAGLGPHDSREALIQSLWAVLDDISKPTGWHVFKECFGTTWQEGLPAWAYNGVSACGGKNPTVSKACQCQIGSAACRSHSWGHRVPSVIKVNLYNGEGALLADSLTINFASQKAEKEDGCGFAGKVASAVAGLLPGPGSLFAAGIDRACDN